MFANPKVLLANPKALLAVELNLVGGTYAERCKTRTSLLASLDRSDSLATSTVSNERGSFEVHDGTERDSGAERTENQCSGMSSVIVIARML